MRRAMGVVAAVLGAVLAAAVLLMSGPAQAQRASDVLRDAEPSVLGQGLADLRQSLADTAPGIEALTSEIPRAAAAKGESPDVLLARHPAVAAALARFDEIGGDAEAVVGNLERQEGDFRRAKRIRDGVVPLTLLPGAAVALGGALVLLGLVTARGWAPGPAVLAVVGLAMVVVPVALGTPAQMQSAATVLDSLKVGPEIPVRTRERFTVIEDAAQELPALVDEMQGSGYTNPAVDRMLSAMPSTLARFGAGVGFREAHGADVAELKRLPLRSLAWAFPGLGAAVVVVAGLALVADRRGRGASSPTHT